MKDDLLLQVDSLRIQSPESERALCDSLTFEVASGECVLLTGMSEEGALWMTRALAGITHPVAGHLKFHAGASVSSKSPKPEVGLDISDLPLLSGRTIAENIILPLELRGKQYGQSLFAELTKEFELEQYLNVLPANAPIYARVFARIVRAFVHEPRLVLLEQPTRLLSSEHTIRLAELLTRQVIRGISCVAVTSDERLLQKLPSARRIVVRTASQMN